MTKTVTLGNSGFGYTSTQDSKSGSHSYTNVKVFNIKTKEFLLTLKGGYRWSGRSMGAERIYINQNKKFLGLDNKYYYIEVSKSGIINWGQIQSDGAVLKSNRTILTTLAFFPHYKEPATTVPAITPIIIKEPPNVPKVVVIPPEPVKTPIEKEDISWIQKIINWIIAILNR